MEKWVEAPKNDSNQKVVAAGVRYLQAKKVFEKGIVTEGTDKEKKRQRLGEESSCKRQCLTHTKFEAPHTK